MSIEAKHFDQCFVKIIEVFTELGYPQKLIEQWTLPQRDARTIAGIINEYQPHNILEVGTYVGLTTILMALISGPETHIHTIDPNFPLLIEMAAMKSRLYESNLTIRTQDLALQAADKLEIKDKITFHAGGFSTNSTFASYNTSPFQRVNIVGPQVCKNFGPFDFVFIDGLHYEEDVFSDIKLAVDFLQPKGLIALHDVAGPWGSNVRRAVYRFLEENNEYNFSQKYISSIYDNIGVIEKHYNKKDLINRTMDDFLKNGGFVQEKMFENLSAIIINMLSPKSILQIGGNINLLEQLVKSGAQGDCSYGTFFQEKYQGTIPITQLSLQKENFFEKKVDLCIVMEIMDIIPQEFIDNVIQTSIKASDNIVFAGSPPGEMGKYGQNNYPVAFWANKYLHEGYLFYDFFRPKIEPHIYSNILSSEYDVYSSYLMNFYLVKKNKNLILEDIPKKYIKNILLEKERRIEDLVLQNLFKNCILRTKLEEYEELKEYYEKLNKEIQEIDWFSRRVISNSLKKLKEKITKKLGLS